MSDTTAPAQAPTQVDLNSLVMALRECFNPVTDLVRQSNADLRADFNAKHLENRSSRHEQANRVDAALLKLSEDAMATRERLAILEDRNTRKSSDLLKLTEELGTVQEQMVTMNTTLTIIQRDLPKLTAAADTANANENAKVGSDKAFHRVKDWCTLLGAAGSFITLLYAAIHYISRH